MMNTKLIALCLVFHVAHSLGGPVNAVSENTTARYDFENSPKERLASQGPMDASVQDGASGNAEKSIMDEEVQVQEEEEPSWEFGMSQEPHLSLPHKIVCPCQKPILMLAKDRREYTNQERSQNEDTSR
ncbi:hypothetical protein BM1_10145 [Bipolaris maydis]|nr:hypothetical protein BM1_10145 [Bipolaris maydis]